MHRQIDRQRARHRQIDRQPDRQRDRQTQADRQKHISNHLPEPSPLVDVSSTELYCETSAPKGGENAGDQSRQYATLPYGQLRMKSHS